MDVGGTNEEDTLEGGNSTEKTTKPDHEDYEIIMIEEPTMSIDTPQGRGALPADPMLVTEIKDESKEEGASPHSVPPVVPEDNVRTNEEETLEAGNNTEKTTKAGHEGYEIIMVEDPTISIDTPQVKGAPPGPMLADEIKDESAEDWVSPHSVAPAVPENNVPTEVGILKVYQPSDSAENKKKYSAEEADTLMKDVEDTVDPVLTAVELDVAVEAFDPAARWSKEAAAMTTTLPSYSVDITLKSFEKELKIPLKKGVEGHGELAPMLPKSLSAGGDSHVAVSSLCRFGELLRDPDLSALTQSDQERFMRIVGLIQDLLASDDGLESPEIVKALLGHVSGLIRIWCPVDLEKLVTLIQENNNTGDDIEGKDVLLLIGSSGCGKTTTLLYLAGTTFEEIETYGFDHLQPVTFPTAELVDFEVSCSTKSVTRCLRSTNFHWLAENRCGSATPLAFSTRVALRRTSIKRMGLFGQFTERERSSLSSSWNTVSPAFVPPLRF
jgi:hypothetical protein